ncbi:uncharacterized protein LOC124329417 [Daphnia pulicaria]|uniref:uncharacterized protein LOC124329417 n=1 Tax=Daphnia pulicaria TaxID=35523 RepID=UPI001EEB7CC0|nr:uncharacterized protein LOC124329417 [Daphnia pulicaria]
MFRLELVIGFLILAVVSGEPQHYYHPIAYPVQYLYPSPVYAVNNQPSAQLESSHQPSEFFRSGGFPYQQEPQQQQPSVPAGIPHDSRFFNLLSGNNGGALIKLTYSTSITTTTNTITKFCTTSTAPLITCSPAGRRRRSASRRGLFHNDDDATAFNEKIDSVKPDSELPAALNEDVKINREARMELPSSSLRSSMSGNRVIGRQLISWGVSTSTVTAIATFTSVLTAVCASTSGFAACVSG